MARGCLTTLPAFVTNMGLVGFRKLCKEGQLDAAIHAVINLMDNRGFRASTNILYCLLQGCIDRKSLVSGRQVHQLIMRSGYILNTFLGSHLIRMFAECGSLLEATQVFDELPDATVYTWSAIILAYAKHGQDWPNEIWLHGMQ